MKTPRPLGALSLFGLLLTVAAVQADPVFSDQVIIKDAAGNTIVNTTRNDSTPSLPELAVTSGPLKIPYNKLDHSFGVVFTDPGNPKFISDWLKVTVHHHPKKNTDTLYIVFKSSPDEQSMKLPRDFPEHYVTIAETGQLQDVTADLFPKYTKAGVAPPFTVQIKSVDPPPPPPVGGLPGGVGVGAAAVPEPASLTLFGLGLLGLGGAAWRKQRKAAVDSPR
jgi:hypothetical protein